QRRPLLVDPGEGVRQGRHLADRRSLLEELKRFRKGEPDALIRLAGRSDGGTEDGVATAARAAATEVVEVERYAVRILEHSHRLLHHVDQLDLEDRRPDVVVLAALTGRRDEEAEAPVLALSLGAAFGGARILRPAR